MVKVSTYASALLRWRWCYGAKRKFSRVNMSEVALSEHDLRMVGGRDPLRRMEPLWLPLYAENHLPRVWCSFFNAIIRFVCALSVSMTLHSFNTSSSFGAERPLILLCVFPPISLMCASSFKFLIRLFADGRLLKQTFAYLAVIICSNISLTRKGLNHRVSVHVMLRYICSVVKLHVSIDWRAGKWSLSHKFCGLSATSTTCINLRCEVVGALTGSGGQDLAEAPVGCRWQITSVSQVIKCPSHARRRAEPPRIRSNLHLWDGLELQYGSTHDQYTFTNQALIMAAWECPVVIEMHNRQGKWGF